MKFRSAYDGMSDDVSRETSVVCPADEGKTQQHFKDECDINEIVRRFGLTGELPENVRLPVSGDFTGVTDFQSAMNMVVEAQDAFMQFPAEIRAQFKNDPQQMISFIEDAKNRDAAIEMGLIPRPPEKTRDVVQAVDELASKLVPPTK